MHRDRTEAEICQPALPDGAPRIRLASPADAPKTQCAPSKPVALIGGRRDCDLYISGDGVSKLHCAIVNTGAAIVVVDLCSRSGTFINNHAISGPVALRPGDELRVGAVTIAVEISTSEKDGDALAGESAVKLDAPLTLSGGGQDFELTTLPAVIGRRQASQVVLDTPDVSLTHALLFLLDGCPAVFDLGSRSGTILNSERTSLAWLRDSDELNIGGEELTLGWEGPEFTPEDAVADSPDDDLVAPGLVAGPPAMAGLDDIGAVIDGLKAQITASQASIQQHAVELDKREAELDQRAESLELERQEFDSGRAALGRERSELKLLAAGIAREREQLEPQRDELERERAALIEEMEAFEQKRGEFNDTLSSLAEREVAVGECEAAVKARADALSKRDAAVTHREVEAADAQAGIDQFKHALDEARRAFGAPEATGAQPAVAPPARRDESRSGNRAQRAISDTGDDLPAPLVDGPLFADAAQPPPADWSPEMVARLQSLRRLSGKADADLIPQVLAEHQAATLEPSTNGEKKKKRKRRWLS